MTAGNCHGDIYSGIICLADISPPSTNKNVNFSLTPKSSQVPFIILLTTTPTDLLTQYLYYKTVHARTSVPILSDMKVSVATAPLCSGCVSQDSQPEEGCL